MTEKIKLPVRISAPVVHGRGLGHSLGAPTMNQPLTGLDLPVPYGVYFSRATVGGVTYNAVTNVGVKPTVAGNDGEPIAETHILDCEGDLYGLDVTTELLLFLRREKKFASEELLARAIAEDVAAAGVYFKNESEEK